jgi:hypothetical protein
MNISQSINWSAIGVLTFVNNALEPNDGKETARDGCASNQAQNNYTKQASSALAVRLLQQLTFFCDGHDCRWFVG